MKHMSNSFMGGQGLAVGECGRVRSVSTIKYHIYCTETADTRCSPKMEDVGRVVETVFDGWSISLVKTGEGDRSFSHLLPTGAWFHVN